MTIRYAPGGPTGAPARQVSSIWSPCTIEVRLVGQVTVTRSPSMSSITGRAARTASGSAAIASSAIRAERHRWLYGTGRGPPSVGTTALLPRLYGPAGGGHTAHSGDRKSQTGCRP